MRVRMRKMAKGSLFKILLIGFMLGLLPPILIFGFAAGFGEHTVRVNGEYLTGIGGFVAAMVMYPIFAVFATIFSWLVLAFGLWAYSLAGRLELELVDGEIVVDSSPPPVMEVLAHSELPPEGGRQEPIA